jgi:hypothetical protein
MASLSAPNPPEGPVDIGNEIFHDIGLIISCPFRVEVLRPSVARHAVHHDQDHLLHQPFSDQAFHHFRHGRSAVAVVQKALSCRGETAEQIDDRKTPFPVVRRGEIDRNVTHFRVAEGVAGKFRSGHSFENNPGTTCRRATHHTATSFALFLLTYAEIPMLTS